MSSNTDKYHIDRQIGKGAYGVAYAARSKVDGRRYVLKKVRLARQSHQERQATLTELLILSNIAHRNVLKYQEAWVESGCISCMVVELCECGDLLTQLRARAGAQQYFHEVHLQDMLVQLASGLDFLHKNCIAHRDIKSSNVFITGDGCLKLADFGLSTLLDPEDPVCRMVVGTPNYMSPELLRDQPYSVKNDVWALGCVMYELSALKPAFQAFNMDGLMKKITSGPTPQLPSHYSEEWKDVVRALLSKEEEFRPSAAQILNMAWLQPAIKRVEALFGPALPEGCKELVQIQDLPEPIAKLARQFKQQERDAELKSAQAYAHQTELQAKWAPRALKERMEKERKRADAQVEAVLAKGGAGGPDSRTKEMDGAAHKDRRASAAAGAGSKHGAGAGGEGGGGGAPTAARRATSDKVLTELQQGLRTPPTGGTRSPSPNGAAAVRHAGSGGGGGGGGGKGTSRPQEDTPAAVGGGGGGGLAKEGLRRLYERQISSCPALPALPEVQAGNAKAGAEVTGPTASSGHSSPPTPGQETPASWTPPRAPIPPTPSSASSSPPMGRPPLAPGHAHPLRASIVEPATHSRHVASAHPLRASTPVLLGRDGPGHSSGHSLGQVAKEAWGSPAAPSTTGPNGSPGEGTWARPVSRGSPLRASAGAAPAGPIPARQAGSHSGAASQPQTPSHANGQHGPHLRRGDADAALHPTHLTASITPRKSETDAMGLGPLRAKEGERKESGRGIWGVQERRATLTG